MRSWHNCCVANLVIIRVCQTFTTYRGDPIAIHFFLHGSMIPYLTTCIQLIPNNWAFVLGAWYQQFGLIHIFFSCSETFSQTVSPSISRSVDISVGLPAPVAAEFFSTCPPLHCPCRHSCEWIIGIGTKNPSWLIRSELTVSWLHRSKLPTW